MGLLRLFLALSVIAGHAQTTVFGVKGIGSEYAVNFFFIISGFYMAMVLNGQYKDVSKLHFYKSRLLRLFPAYYVGLALSFIVYFSSIAYFFGTLTPFSKFIYVFQNAFIVGQDLSHIFCVPNTSGLCADPFSLTINLPAWSLAVELGFYLVAPFILKSQVKTFAFVLFGALYLFVLNAIEFPLPDPGLLGASESKVFNYYFYPSSFAFFGGGALAYHFSKSQSEPNYFWALAALILLSFAQTTMPFWHLLFFAMAIPVMFKYTAKNRIDRLIGELSYPVYIVHFPIMIWLREVVSKNPTLTDYFSLGTLTSIASIIVGLVVYFTIEQKVSKFRHSKQFFSAGGEWKKTIGDVLSRFSLFVYLAVPVITVSYLMVVRDIQSIPSDTPYDLTDQNWYGGVSRNSASFFIKANKANLEAYKVGRKIRLGASEEREIVAVDTSGGYMNIHLSGEALDGEVSGYPNKIELENKRLPL